MKRISPGTVTFGVLAILLGLVAAYVARRSLDVKPKIAPEGVAVVVSQVNLPRHSRIRRDDLQVLRVPRGQVPQGAVTSAGVAAGRLVKQTIVAGNPIVEETLYGIGETPKLSDRIPPGQRAIAISVSGYSRTLIRPGVAVDVALTVEDDHPELGGEGGLGTMTLVENVRVLATSRRASRRSAGGNRAGHKITVAVTSEQANKLILAERYGTLNVTLRSAVPATDDRFASTGDGLINPRDLLGLPPLRESLAHTAVIWRGGERHQVTFDSGLILESKQATIASQRRHKTPIVPTSYGERGATSPDVPVGDRQ